MVVDDNPEGRFLLTKTLLRKYPQSVVHECQELEVALEVIREFPRDARSVVIAHRATGMDGRSLVKALRQENATIPIVWISGRDRTADLAPTGATRFLHYDAWLMIGPTIEDLYPRSQDEPSTDDPPLGANLPAGWRA